MRELIGMGVAVVIVFIAGGAIFSAIRHRRSSVGRGERWIGSGPPKPRPRPVCRLQPRRRPTLEELRARVALAQAPPVCPDCGGIMHKEDDVDPKGIWFVSWRCDCLWTPSKGG